MDDATGPSTNNHISAASDDSDINAVYEELRPLMFSIAYRMLGSATEAEDLVQEAYLRFHRATSQGEVIESPKAYLSTVTTRLAIDALRSARARHEAYVGLWLPEPLMVSTDADPAEQAEVDESLSLAFLVVLQTLSPVERAIFLLRDVFDYDYAKIASITGKSEDNCRQILARARKRIGSGQPRFTASKQDQRELATRFFAAADQGNLTGLVNYLAADATFYGDGGGKAQAFPRPVHGREHVARLFAGIFTKGHELAATWRFAFVNGQPGMLAFDANGGLITVMALDIGADGLVRTIRSIVNPDKIGHLGFPLTESVGLIKDNRDDA
jgi:RNA polymerase sigma-70 factor (TIGR02957 family)